jgi:peptide chain release factor 2
MSRPDFWDDRKKALKVISEHKKVLDWIEPISDLLTLLGDISAAVELLESEYDAGLETDYSERLTGMGGKLDRLEFRQMLSGPHDNSDAILAIRPGAGGIDSQDWADMLFRMYIYWAEKQGFEIEIMSYQEGEEAGIREAIVSLKGPYVYGYLRAEAGIHRLVRRSPFDQNHRRHTSFASVYPLPDLEDDIEIDIRDDDVRVDTFRASGAGGQHVNKTDSAVRMTHLPTGITVTCQNQRSQHRNREVAMRILRARLYEHEEKKRQEEKARLEKEKVDVSWGNQIRSYVLQPYRMVKDHRTGIETSDVDGVLTGNIQDFIEAFLREDSQGA